MTLGCVHLKFIELTFRFFTRFRAFLELIDKNLSRNCRIWIVEVGGRKTEIEQEMLGSGSSQL